MASLRHIRRRIRSIQSTKQIMRAMQLVSGSKFKRAQGRLLQSRQVLEFLDELLLRVLASLGPSRQSGRAHRGAASIEAHPLLRKTEASPSSLVIVTSDAGLAGSYNTNLIQLAESELRRDSAGPTEVTYIGKKGYRYFTKRGFAAKDAFLDLAGRPDVDRIDAIAQRLMERFLRGEVSSVKLLYAKFVSASVSRPTALQWLPITLNAPRTVHRTQKGRTQTSEYIFEPSPERVFEALLPQWAIGKFRLSLLEAFTSEHGARMIAMKNATDNAQELLGSLTRQRNRIRQASITKELSEIVGTAEALK